MFVDLGIQHAMRMRPVLLSSVACPAIQYFSTLSHNRKIFDKRKGILYKMCFEFLYKSCREYISF